jgi:hypothetical protein
MANQRTKYQKSTSNIFWVIAYASSDNVADTDKEI